MVNKRRPKSRRDHKKNAATNPPKINKRQPPSSIDPTPKPQHLLIPDKLNAVIAVACDFYDLDFDQIKDTGTAKLQETIQSDSINVEELGDGYVVGNSSGIEMLSKNRTLESRVEDLEQTLKDLRETSNKTFNEHSQILNEHNAIQLGFLSARHRFLSTYKRDTETENDSDRVLIRKGNSAVHSGNAVLDAKLYQSGYWQQRNDVETYESLYGLTPQVVRRCQAKGEFIQALNNHATKKAKEKMEEAKEKMKEAKEKMKKANDKTKKAKDKAQLDKAQLDKDYENLFQDLIREFNDSDHDLSSLDDQNSKVYFALQKFTSSHFLYFYESE